MPGRCRRRSGLCNGLLATMAPIPSSLKTASAWAPTALSSRAELNKIVATTADENYMLLKNSLLVGNMVMPVLPGERRDGKGTFSPS